MTTFTFLVLCVQACLIQSVYGCGSAIRPTMIPSFPVPKYAPTRAPAYPPACSPGLAVPAALAPGAYGGEGIGDIAITGKMPVAGTTAVAGQVPILGSVRFGGNVPARGTVTITGGSSRAASASRCSCRYY